MWSRIRSEQRERRVPQRARRMNGNLQMPMVAAVGNSKMSEDLGCKKLPELNVVALNQQWGDGN